MILICVLPAIIDLNPTLTMILGLMDPASELQNSHLPQKKKFQRLT